MAASGINWCIATRSRYCTLADHSIRPSSSSVPEGSSTSVDPSLDHPTPPTPVRPNVPRGSGSHLSARARSALFALCLDNPPAPAAVSSPLPQCGPRPIEEADVVGPKVRVEVEGPILSVSSASLGAARGRIKCGHVVRTELRRGVLTTPECG